MHQNKLIVLLAFLACFFGLNVLYSSNNTSVYAQTRSSKLSKPKNEEQAKKDNKKSNKNSDDETVYDEDELEANQLMWLVHYLGPHYKYHKHFSLWLTILNVIIALGLGVVGFWLGKTRIRGSYNKRIILGVLIGFIWFGVGLYSYFCILGLGLFILAGRGNDVGLPYTDDNGIVHEVDPFPGDMYSKDSSLYDSTHAGFRDEDETIFDKIARQQYQERHPNSDPTSVDAVFGDGTENTILASGLDFARFEKILNRQNIVLKIVNNSNDYIDYIETYANLEYLYSGLTRNYINGDHNLKSLRDYVAPSDFLAAIKDKIQFNAKCDTIDDIIVDKAYILGAGTYHGYTILKIESYGFNNNYQIDSEKPNYQRIGWTDIVVFTRRGKIANIVYGDRSDVSDQNLNSLDLIKTDYTEQDMQDLANI